MNRIWKSWREANESGIFAMPAPPFKCKTVTGNDIIVKNFLFGGVLCIDVENNTYSLDFIDINSVEEIKFIPPKQPKLFAEDIEGLVTSETSLKPIRELRYYL